MPWVNRCLETIESTWVSHSSTCERYVGSEVRAVPFVATSQPGKPPASISALMYGPGRRMT